jgi:cell division protein FtsB
MADKAELVIMALQQRIGELVSNYETQIAILRAELTQISQDKEDKEKAIKDYEDSLPA